MIHQTTPEEAARIDRLAELAEQDRDDLVERYRLQELAAAEPTFRGELLRAIDGSDVPLEELAELAGVDPLTFDDFRCGRFDLSLEAFERVARRLGLTLVKAA
jgi:hypothetical protein